MVLIQDLLGLINSIIILTVFTVFIALVINYLRKKFKLLNRKQKRQVILQAIAFSVLFGILANIRGIGWMYFDCVFTPEGGESCGGFAGNPILWGLGNNLSVAGFFLGALWWVILGSIVSYVLVSYRIHKKHK